MSGHVVREDASPQHQLLGLVIAGELDETPQIWNDSEMNTVNLLKLDPNIQMFIPVLHWPEHLCWMPLKFQRTVSLFLLQEKTPACKEGTQFHSQFEESAHKSVHKKKWIKCYKSHLFLFFFPFFWLWRVLILVGHRWHPTSKSLPWWF